MSDFKDRIPIKSENLLNRHLLAGTNVTFIETVKPAIFVQSIPHPWQFALKKSSMKIVIYLGVK